MFGNNGDKKLSDIAPPLGDQISLMPGETWVFFRQRPEGVEVRASENIGNDSLALLNLVHHAVFGITSALVQIAAKERSRIVQVPPGTTLRKA